MTANNAGATRPSITAAIHFHEDDIYDFGWETDFSFSHPQMICRRASTRFACDRASTKTPFPLFVCPPKGERRADLCLLVSTFHLWSSMATMRDPITHLIGRRRFDAGTPIRIIRRCTGSMGSPPTTITATAPASATPRTAGRCSTYARVTSPSATARARATGISRRTATWSPGCTRRATPMTWSPIRSCMTTGSMRSAAIRR